MACLSGFLRQTRIIDLSLSCNCCTAGQQLQNDTIPICSCLFGLIKLKCFADDFRADWIVLYNRQFRMYILNCLLYKTIQSALKSSAKHFNLDEAWFNTQSIRMSVPTIARAAREPISTILHMGRWKTVPSSMKCQEQSTAVNDHIISIASNPTYLTTEDILLSRTLATRAPRSNHSANKTTPTVRRLWVTRLC